MVAGHIGPGISFTAYEILSFKAEMKQIKFFFADLKFSLKQNQPIR